MAADELDPRSVAVSVARTTNAKIAGLYFDYVVPICCDDVPRELFPPAFGDWEPASPQQLLRKAQAYADSKFVSVPIVDGTGARRHVKLVKKDGEPDIEALELVNEWYFLEKPELQKKLHQQMHNANIDDAPVLLSRQVLDLTRSAKTLGDVMLTLSNIPLVQVDGAAWEQILDLRQDAASRRKLRLLRHFLASEYIGKTAEQIEAGIALRMDEHERAAKKHGFKLVFGTLQAACDSKALLASAGLGAITGSLIGGEPGAAVGAKVGLSLEVAKMSLTVAKSFYDMRALRKYHPLSYVIEAQRRIHP